MYSTASYQAKNLQGIGLRNIDLIGWDFSGQDLRGADMNEATLSNTNLAGANLKNANFFFTHGLESTVFNAATVYNQWTVFPGDFDAVEAGLTLELSPAGDFNADDQLNVDDVDRLGQELPGGLTQDWLPSAMFDLNRDGYINEEDHRFWIKDLKQTWFGDANLDGEFDSGDLVQVLRAGKYDQGFAYFLQSDLRGQAAGWAEGDWNADGVFDSRDFVIALADGGYEQGPLVTAAAVPEPTAAGLIALGAIGALRYRR